MNSKSFELALHRWPEWKISIQSGRDQIVKGGSKPDLEKMRSVAQSALVGMGFPECTMMELYWLCCVFSDYERGTQGLSFDFHQLILPDWFPLPFGFKLGWEVDFKGQRIRPPDVWSEAEAKFWENKSPLAKILPDSLQGKCQGHGFPDTGFTMVLPADHPVRKLVKPGRPNKDTLSGESNL